MNRSDVPIGTHNEVSNISRAFLYGYPSTYARILYSIWRPKIRGVGLTTDREMKKKKVHLHKNKINIIHNILYNTGIYYRGTCNMYKKFIWQCILLYTGRFTHYCSYSNSDLRNLLRFTVYILRKDECPVDIIQTSFILIRTLLFYCILFIG